MSASQEPDVWQPQAGDVITAVTVAARMHVGAGDLYLVGYDDEDEGWIITRVADHSDEYLSESLQQDLFMSDADVNKHFAFVRHIAY